MWTSFLWRKCSGDRECFRPFSASLAEFSAVLAEFSPVLVEKSSLGGRVRSVPEKIYRDAEENYLAREETLWSRLKKRKRCAAAATSMSIMFSFCGKAQKKSAKYLSIKQKFLPLHPEK